MFEAGVTRRGLITGTLAGAGVAVAAPARAEAPCVPAGPGVPTVAIAAMPHGRAVWSTDARERTICTHRPPALTRGRRIDVGGAPRDIAIHGHTALVTTAFYDQPGLVVVQLARHRARRLAVGSEPHSVAWSRDGRRAFVTGGGAEGTLTEILPAGGHVHDPVALGAHPHGVAVTPDGHVLVALNGEACVLVLHGGKAVRRIRTRAFPHRIAVHGDHALVTHNGYGDATVTPLDWRRGRARKPIRVGLDPAGVAFSRSGRTAIVAVAGAGRAVVLGTGRRVHRLPGTPSAVAVTGRHAVVADAHTGELRRVGGLR